MQKVWKALSDPTRRKILQLLKERDMSAGEIAEHFDVSKPTLSHHLEILRNADLVVSHRKGQKIIYSLNTTVLDEVVAYLMELLEKKR
ncbi:MAG: transcriptional regulator [Candidatus Hydrothermota bacterium]|nr:MAG: transcriptional regulator [Candidatus Hydrothermae bacterium]